MLESNAARIIFGAGVLMCIIIVGVVLKINWPIISETIHKMLFSRGMFVKH